MKKLQLITLSVISSCLLWAIYSWPLPRHFRSAIPWTASADPGPAVHAPRPCDSFQFLYQLWLFKDMLAGRTEAMHDIYQFNTGDDGERLRIKSFYFPFSLLYAAAEPVLGRAGSYNLLGLTVLCVGVIITALLISRFDAGPAQSVMLGILASAFPYRWFALMNGSPTGLAMIWWPMIMLGLDMAIASGMRSGGWIAGFGIIFASWTDPHVFFFSALASPFWALFSAWRAGMRLSPSNATTLTNILRCIIPFIALGIVAVAWFLLGLKTHGQRAIFENSAPVAVAALYSPAWHGFFDMHASGKSAFIYVGIAMTLLVAGATAAASIRIRQRKKKPAVPEEADILLVLLSACVAIAILALGTNGPFSGRVIFALRRILPPYAMIRQPHKIFCLLPPLAATVSFFALRLWAQMITKRYALLMWAALQTLILVEFSVRISPGLTRVPNEHPTYDAAAMDAILNGKEPRAIAIPLRSGTEHDSSLQVYFASLNRIRLANGYSPVVPESYQKRFLPTFTSLNCGLLSDKQIRDLERRGFSFLLFHENLFYDNTDVFPSSLTLERLFNNPRLTVLNKNGPIWCFKFLPNRASSKIPAPRQPFLASDFRWEVEEHGRIHPSQIMTDKEAGTLKAVNLSAGMVVEGPECRLVLDGIPCWFIRARGSGTFAIATKSDGSILEMNVHDLKSTDWQWVKAPLPIHHTPIAARARIEMIEGSVLFDCGILGDARWQSPEQGQTLYIPARALFHTGASSPDMDAVTWDPAFSPPGIALHGPGFPLEKGLYRLSAELTSSASPGKLLGRIQVKWPAGNETTFWDVLSGAECSVEFRQASNLPWEIILHYEGTSDMHLYGFRLSRVE